MGRNAKAASNYKHQVTNRALSISNALKSSDKDPKDSKLSSDLTPPNILSDLSKVTIEPEKLKIDINIADNMKPLAPQLQGSPKLKENQFLNTSEVGNRYGDEAKEIDIPKSVLQPDTLNKEPDINMNKVEADPNLSELSKSNAIIQGVVFPRENDKQSLCYSSKLEGGQNQIPQQESVLQNLQLPLKDLNPTVVSANTERTFSSDTSNNKDNTINNKEDTFNDKKDTSKNKEETSKGEIVGAVNTKLQTCNTLDGKYKVDVSENKQQEVKDTSAVAKKTLVVENVVEKQLHKEDTKKPLLKLKEKLLKKDDDGKNSIYIHIYIHKYLYLDIIFK